MGKIDVMTLEVYLKVKTAIVVVSPPSPSGYTHALIAPDGETVGWLKPIGDGKYQVAMYGEGCGTETVVTLPEGGKSEMSALKDLMGHREGEQHGSEGSHATVPASAELAQLLEYTLHLLQVIDNTALIPTSDLEALHATFATLSGAGGEHGNSL